jgi:hypothetical protein
MFHVKPCILCSWLAIQATRAYWLAEYEIEKSNLVNLTNTGYQFAENASVCPGLRGICK